MGEKSHGQTDDSFCIFVAAAPLPGSKVILTVTIKAVEETMVIGLSAKGWYVFSGVEVGNTRQTIKIFERENNLAFKG